LQQYDDALAACDRALALNDNLAEAWFGRAEILVQRNEPEKALAAFDRALALKRDIRLGLGGRLLTKLLLSDWTNLEAELAELAATVKAGDAAAAPFDFLAMSRSAADQLACAKRVMADQPTAPHAWRGEIYSHDRIRIGYFSADFRTHPVAQLVAGLFEHHDKSRFEISAFSYGPDDGSQLRKRIKTAVENFVDVRAMTDEEIAETIRRREIDVLVDLTGLTQYNRFSVLSRRVAPIQVNFLGFAGTTGADWMDYIVADPTLIPEDQTGFYSERVVWLPDTYQPNDKRLVADRLPTRAECNLPEAGFVLCCFNSAYKIIPEVFAVWMKLLDMVEGSVLWLLEGNPTAVQNLRNEAKARGVSSDRLIFAPKLPVADHLSRHRHADLFLDTLPYNAHTTASDALRVGVPVLTRQGETFAGRVAASLLKAVGLPELITTSLEDYESLALKLAREPSLLAAFKAKLARNLDTCPLFDTARFARHIEAAYTTMWQRHQSSAAPQRFAVERTD
jgi:protein O-GlcNAc transferase